MAEYIERNKIFSVWRSMPEPSSVKSLATAIHQTPAIDVVLCKDCKYAEKDDIHQVSLKCTRFRTGAFTHRMHPVDFCSYGERRGGE